MNWKSAHLQVFWGELAPSDHVVQIYENQTILLNTLEGFAGDGFMKKEAVVVIATTEHLNQLDRRLEMQGFQVKSLKDSGRYVALEAEESLESFETADGPDQPLFSAYVTAIMERVQTENGKIRIFDELPALLRVRGYEKAAGKLEQLWLRHQQKRNFCLFEAYPRSCFPEELQGSLSRICTRFTKVIDGGTRPSTEIHFQTMESGEQFSLQESA